MDTRCRTEQAVERPPHTSKTLLCVASWPTDPPQGAIVFGLTDSCPTQGTFRRVTQAEKPAEKVCLMACLIFRVLDATCSIGFCFRCDVGIANAELAARHDTLPSPGAPHAHGAVIFLEGAPSPISALTTGFFQRAQVTIVSVFFVLVAV